MSIEDERMSAKAVSADTREKKRLRKALIDSEEAEPTSQASVAEQGSAKDLENGCKEEPTKQHAKRAKTGAVQNRRAPNLAEEDLEKYAYDVINCMKGCFNEDLRLNQQNKPSSRKIENIEDICSKIMRKKAREVLLRMGVLNELRTWLEPLPDNSLPNPKIKKWILDLLLNLRVSKSDLLASGIGKIVHFYSKNPKEATDVRKLASKVAKRWKTQIIKEELEE